MRSVPSGELFSLSVANWKRISAAAGLSCDVQRGGTRPDPGCPLTGRPAATADGWILGYPEGGWYRVSRTTGLSIELVEEEGQEEVNLLRRAGPVTALVMALAGFSPLHACGILTPRGMVGIFAPSGGGKSTLAANALSNGWLVAGDDLLALRPDGGVLPLRGSLRVHPSAASPDWHPVMALVDGRKWYDLPPIEPAPQLRALMHLRRGGPPALVAVTGAKRLATMAAAGLLSFFGSSSGSWHAALLELAANIPAWELIVPDDLDQLQSAWPRIADLLTAASG